MSECILFMSKDLRKEELKNAWKQQENQDLVDSIPMLRTDLQALFNFLGRGSTPPCDHTLRETTQFLQQRRLNVERILPWLHENGGYCDCEVICNVEDKFGEIFGQQ